MGNKLAIRGFMGRVGIVHLARQQGHLSRLGRGARALAEGALVTVAALAMVAEVEAGGLGRERFAYSVVSTGKNSGLASTPPYYIRNTCILKGGGNAIFNIEVLMCFGLL